MRTNNFVFFSEYCQELPGTVWCLELCSKYLLDELNELLSVVSGGLAGWADTEYCCGDGGRHDNDRDWWWPRDVKEGVSVGGVGCRGGMLARLWMTTQEVFRFKI